jgi:3-phosphoshikimate 1-carboxyvinyltransferase
MKNGKREMLKISSGNQIRGRIVLPASKSISNRALVLNALSKNALLPDNLSDSDDTQVMIRALQSLSGSPSTGRADNRRLPPEVERMGRVPIDIGAAGTAMRFMTAFLSVTPGEHVITGTERMKHRPIGILVDALRQLGANIKYEGEEGFPPLRITGRDDLEGGALTVPGNVSSQYISALLMIAPTLRKGLRLTLTGTIASRPYLDMTISMMRDFGAKVGWQGDDAIEVEPRAYLQRAYHIESDWSAASYWYEIVALSRDANAEVELIGLHHDSIQGDSRVWRMFGELGVETQFYVEPDGTEVTRLRKSPNITSFFSQDFTHQPDLAQTFAVTCAMLGVPFHLFGLQSLRIKETDRIAALEKELGKLVDVEVQGNDLLMPSSEGKANVGLSIEGKAGRGPLAFDTYEDHRMAMAFAPVCLRTDCQIQINNPQVVSKSYPRFWDDLSAVGFKIESPSDSPLQGENQDAETISPTPDKGEAGRRYEAASWCCGQHEVCEMDSLLDVSEADYYEDEELDRFRGRTSYSEEEVEEFREVLYTMRPDEVSGWLHSLELRRVNLPDELKDEAFLIIRENGG